jgi:endonuclease YncB( thermonuclease family)
MPAPSLGLTARAIVDRVIDGDTLDVLITVPVRVRMLDCWAPETRGDEKPQGEASKSLLEQMAPVGSKVLVNIPTTHVDALAGVFTFGRVLGEVWRPGDDESLSVMMVAAGAATKEKAKP